MPLEQIDISEAQLIPMAANLANLVNTYNQWVDAVNSGTASLADNADTMRGILDQLHELATLGFNSVQTMGQMIEPLGLPDDFGWSWELGQLVNACNTAKTDIDEALAAASAT